MTVTIGRRELEWKAVVKPSVRGAMPLLYARKRLRPDIGFVADEFAIVGVVIVLDDQMHSRQLTAMPRHARLQWRHLVRAGGGGDLHEPHDCFAFRRRCVHRHLNNRASCGWLRSRLV